ncbi:DMT family transporter [Roseibium sp.]|uniref:DMT family transporter n=1 Tax=Roseibium sp. TaxID=1936156 RepID=UPI003A988171
MTLINWALLFLLATIWGCSFIFAKVAVAVIPPLLLVFFRVAIAGIVLHLVLRLKGQRFPWTRQAFGPFLMMGLLNNAIPFSLLFVGQTALSASLASILNASTPIFTFVIAAVWLKQETTHLHRVAGVLLGFAGVAALLSSSLAGLAHDPVWAQLACLGAALSYGFAASYARRLRHHTPLVAATGQLTGSSLLMLPVALVFIGAWSPLETPWTVWASLIGLSVVATAGAYLIYFRLLASAGATNASVVTMIVPAVAVIFGITLLGEALTLTQVGGLGLLLFGLLILDGRILRSFKASEPA